MALLVSHFVLCIACLVAAAILSPVTCRSPQQSRGYDDRDLMEVLRISRRNMCVVSGGKCFTTGHCCNGLVCAAIDDYSGEKPEVPGYCVKEKDLKVCEVNNDCEVDGRCLPLGRLNERYCLPKSGLRFNDQAKLVSHSKVGGGLGAPCDVDSDCRPFTTNGADRLCCQEVRKGRQGVKRLCDRITAISACVSVRK